MLNNFHQRTIFIISVLFLFSGISVFAQNTATPKLWHNKERVMNYHPDGGDIVIINGKHRFNRGLYGTNTAFRVETGDLPEFALYLPGMGGNMRLGLINGNTSKWLIDADQVEARYRAGSMIYTIHDAALGKGVLTITVLAGGSTECLLVKTEFKNVDVPIKFFWAFGGATGKKFSRDGDLGADPESSFYLKPEYCANNNFKIDNNSFTLGFAGTALSDADRYEIKQPGIAQKTVSTTQQKILSGIFPPGAALHIADAGKQGSPLEMAQSVAASAPAITGILSVENNNPQYFYIENEPQKGAKTYAELPALFNAAELARQKIANRIKVNTPDPYINTLGGVLAIAADAIWESPSYMHGANAWRMRLNAWRGPYVADVLGWHDRAESHFSSYALSQIISPESGPVVPDTALHFARQQEKLGTAMFSSGYISRNPGGKIVPHHYDMNLVFIDALLNHFKWTGDLNYVKKMWPLIKRHLAWEKRNFDADGDGLYDAYCAIWASDALQYSGGGVTHSSAYNYKANKMAAEICKLIGEDPAPYVKEAEHILKAINKTLWLPQTGQYAEYQDLLGERLIHPSAGLWTVYHAIDSEVPDQFQAYQALRYVETQIPHIPIIANGVPEGLYTLSTTNWMPYDWSLNNVVLAENLHTSLAYWQGGRPEEAFKLWKGSLLESMFLESSPGNFENMSFYDANRGELYRDFGDPIGMAGRTLVEGLFGIHPDALKGTLTIKPGFPAEWDHASLHTPDIDFVYQSKTAAHTLDNGALPQTDHYTITPHFPKAMNLVFEVKARFMNVLNVTVNDQKVQWKSKDDAVDIPVLQLNSGIKSKYNIKITWGIYEAIEMPKNQVGKKNYDPQNIKLKQSADFPSNYGPHTMFAPVHAGDFRWWEPVNIQIKPEVNFVVPNQQATNVLKFKVGCFDCKVTVNPGINQFVVNNPKDTVTVLLNSQIPGSNVVKVEYGNKVFQQKVVNWNITNAPIPKFDTISLTPYFNDQLTNIFKNKYLSPRPQSPTLQLPWQGIGDWCYPLVDINIDDSGLRKAAGSNNLYTIPQHIVFATPGTAGTKNIMFTSQWDNYPKKVSIPLSGKSSHAYFLMAGSTNPMQSRITNGRIIVEYTDHSTAILDLKNPGTWWPIEQDYDDDGYAFQLNAAKPLRVYLKTGLATTTFKNFYSIKGFSNRGVDGGAATVLDLPLDVSKELKSLTLKTLANDVVIGLMSVTLVRTTNP